MASAMPPNSEGTCASKLAEVETGAKTRIPGKHGFRRRPSKSSAVATAAAQAATTTKPASMAGMAKTWFARLRGDNPPGSTDKIPTAEIIPKKITGLPEGTKGRRSKQASIKGSQQPQQQQIQQAAPEHQLLAELVSEARATAEQAVTAAQLKAQQLAAANHDVQQQLAEVQQKSALLERLCNEADEAVKAAAKHHQQLSADKQLLNPELSSAKTTQSSQAEQLSRLTTELKQVQTQLEEAKQSSGQLQWQSVEPNCGTEIVLTELIHQLDTARAAQAVKESNIQDLTAELAAAERALVDAEYTRAKIEGRYEQATAAASSMLLSQHQLTTDLDRLTSELSAAHTAQLVQEDIIQQRNAELVARQQHLGQVVARCVRLEEKYAKSKTSKRQAAEANRQLSQELAAAVADQKAKAAELQQLNADLQNMQQQLEEAAGTTDKLMQLCRKAASSAASASSAQQQLTSELGILSGDLLQARTDYDAQQARLDEVSSELCVVHDQLAVAQQTIRDLEHYYKQAIAINNVNWQNCLLYGQEHSGVLPEASVVTEASRWGLPNSTCQQCKAVEAALGPELSTASSSTGQCVMRQELSEALNSTQQDGNTGSDPSSPLLAMHLSASKLKLEDQLAILLRESSVPAIAQQEEPKSQIASGPELFPSLELSTLSPELSTAFYSARGDFDAHRDTLSAELSEPCELQSSQEAKISQLTAQMSPSQDRMAEAVARIAMMEALCAKADAAIQSATQIQDQLTLDKAQLKQQLLHAESSSAEQQQKLYYMDADLVALQQELEYAHEKIESLEQSCFEASQRYSSSAGSFHSSGSGHPSQAEQLQALLGVLTVAVQQLEVAEAVSCSLQQQVETVSAAYQQHLADRCLQTTTSNSSAGDPAQPQQQPDQLSSDSEDLCQQLAAAQEVQASQKAALQSMMEELIAAREDLMTAETEIQQLCERINDPPPDVQQLTEKLDVARAAQAAQQVKLLELTAELKRVQQQLLGAEERNSQLEQLYEEVSDASFAAQPKPPPRTQALLEQIASLKQSESEQATNFEQLTSKLSTVQQQLVEVHARCLELEDERNKAQLLETEATAAQQQLQQQMHEHQQTLNSSKSAMAGQRVKMQHLKCELEASRAMQELQNTQMASMDSETARLKKMLFERDPDAAYKAALRHMDNLDPATKATISDKLHHYSLYPKPDTTPDSPMDPKLAKTLLKCITYAPAVRSILVLKQILQMDGVSHFEAFLLKGAAKLLATEPKRFQVVQPKRQKSGSEESWNNLAAGRSASNNGRVTSNNGRATSNNGSTSQWDKRRGSDPGFCSIDVDKLLTAAVPYASEGERLLQHERTQSILVATCLLQQNSSSSSTGDSSSLHYSGGRADLMYWYEAVEAVAKADASVRKDIIQMILAGPGSLDRSDRLQFVSGEAWIDCLRGVYWLDADYRLARSLLGLEGLVVECPAAAAAAAAGEADKSAESDPPDAQANSSSSSGGATREGIEVLRDLAHKYFDHVCGHSSNTVGSKSAGGRMRSISGFIASSSGGRITVSGRSKRLGAGSVPGVRVGKHHSGSQM